MESSVASKKLKVPKNAAPSVPDGKKWIPKTVKGIWIAFICMVTLPPLYVYTMSVDLFGLYGEMPGYAAIENPENDLSSELISADGISLGRYFRYNRSQVNYQQLSP